MVNLVLHLKILSLPILYQKSVLTGVSSSFSATSSSWIEIASDAFKELCKSKTEVFKVQSVMITEPF